MRPLLIPIAELFLILFRNRFIGVSCKKEYNGNE